MMLDNHITTQTDFLEQIILALKGNPDYAAQHILHDATNVLQKLRFLRDIPEHKTMQNVSEFAEQTNQLVKRTKVYCEENRIRFLSLKTPITALMSRAEILLAVGSMVDGDAYIEAVEAMPKKASIPPPSMQAALEEAQLIDSIPRDRDTSPLSETPIPKRER